MKNTLKISPRRFRPPRPSRRAAATATERKPSVSSKRRAKLDEQVSQILDSETEVSNPKEALDERLFNYECTFNDAMVHPGLLDQSYIQGEILLRKLLSGQRTNQKALELQNVHKDKIIWVESSLSTIIRKMDIEEMHLLRIQQRCGFMASPPTELRRPSDLRRQAVELDRPIPRVSSRLPIKMRYQYADSLVDAFKEAYKNGQLDAALRWGKTYENLIFKHIRRHKHFDENSVLHQWHMFRVTQIISKLYGEGGVVDLMDQEEKQQDESNSQVTRPSLDFLNVEATLHTAFQQWRTTGNPRMIYECGEAYRRHVLAHAPQHWDKSTASVFMQLLEIVVGEMEKAVERMDLLEIVRNRRPWTIEEERLYLEQEYQSYKQRAKPSWKGIPLYTGADLLQKKRAINASGIDGTCAVCLDKFSTDLRRQYCGVLPCKHAFCFICLPRLKNTTNGSITCPVCRQVCFGGDGLPPI